MSDAKAKAMAALMDLIGRGQQLQAAIIRGAAAEEIEVIRQDAMAVAEGYLDRTAETAHCVRAMIDTLPDADKLGEAGARRLLD